jgi:hypothetical protein
MDVFIPAHGSTIIQNWGILKSFFSRTGDRQAIVSRPPGARRRLGRRILPVVAAPPSVRWFFAGDSCQP